MDKIAQPITVSFTDEAKAEWRAIPEPIRARLLTFIREKARYSHEQMCVIGWTCDPEREHIYKVFKAYAVPPSWRIIFHHEDRWENIVIDRVARRCDDPYSDSH